MKFFNSNLKLLQWPKKKKKSELLPVKQSSKKIEKH